MLVISGLGKSYSDADRRDNRDDRPWAIRNIDLLIEAGEFFTLLGPSGCGKTTLLRCVAGLETPNEGTIQIGDEVVFDSVSGVEVPTQRRNLGMVFQSYAVWPHMTVAQNVAFPLKAARVPRAEATHRVQSALALVGLESYASRPATTLSGGQQQRVAFARAVVRGAKLLLLDEPLSNLDAKLRVTMRDELLDLQRKLGVTTVYVTHDQDEALSMSDRIGLVNDGRLVEIGTPRQLYAQPRSSFAARFVGRANVFPVSSVTREDERRVLVHTPAGQFIVNATEHVHSQRYSLVVRPEAARFLEPTSLASSSEEVAPPTKENVIEGRVSSVSFEGARQIVHVEVGSVLMLVEEDTIGRRHAGDGVILRIDPSACRLVGETDETAEGE